MYYLRSKAASQAVQFTVEKQGGKTAEPLVEPKQLDKVNDDNSLDISAPVDESLLNGGTCTMEDGCVSCGS